MAMARDWLKRWACSAKRSSQLRSSVVTTVPVRSRSFSTCPLAPVISLTAWASATCTSAMGGTGISVGSMASST